MTSTQVDELNTERLSLAAGPEQAQTECDILVSHMHELKGVPSDV